MKGRNWVAPIVVLFLGACTASIDGTGDRVAQFAGDVPDAVASIAAPYQDLQSARLLPDDGCYWYRHVGPVETTLLPLRTVDGRPICTASGPDAATAS